VWGRPRQQQAAAGVAAAAGSAEERADAAGAPGEQLAAAASSAGGEPAQGALLRGGQREAPVAMERASSSSGVPLSMTPVNFPGMHAVRRSSDLSSTLDEASEPQG
jgi:hypothetical protein